MAPSSRSASRGRSPFAVAVWIAVGLAAVIAVLVVTVGRDSGPPSVSVTAPGHVSTQSQGDAPRIVMVSATETDASETPAGPAKVTLLSGTMPAAPTPATVISDENCAPDASGASHCLNRLRMPDGSVMSVRHNHMMGEGVACLAVGDRVTVEPLA